jgi:SAM-dependent methyltransferase
MRFCLNCHHQFLNDGWRCPKCGESPKLVDGFYCFAVDQLEHKESFDPTYFAELARFEEGNFWFKARNENILHVFSAHFPDARDFLEIGVGSGFVLRGFLDRFPLLKIRGSELYLEGLKFARIRLPEVELYQLDARKLPFTDYFDVLGAFDVLEHIRQDDDVLEEMFRAVRPGGGIIVTVPQHAYLWSVVDEISFHKRRYSRQDLFYKLTRVGFIVKYATSFNSLPYPALFLSRRLKRVVSTEKYHRMAEYKMPRLVNSILDTTLKIESLLLKLGVRFPFGGSLMVVAKKPS